LPGEKKLYILDIITISNAYGGAKMNVEQNSPETSPCPECGGPRVAHHDIGPEIVAFSATAAKNWERTRKEGKFKLIRCTSCGYSAFFYIRREESV
jgi:hypothetical protein